MRGQEVGKVGRPPLLPLCSDGRLHMRLADGTGAAVPPGEERGAPDGCGGSARLLRVLHCCRTARRWPVAARGGLRYWLRMHTRHTCRRPGRLGWRVTGAAAQPSSSGHRLARACALSARASSPAARKPSVSRNYTSMQSAAGGGGSCVTDVAVAFSHTASRSESMQPRTQHRVSLCGRRGGRPLG